MCGSDASSNNDNSTPMTLPTPPPPRPKRRRPMSHGPSTSAPSTLNKHIVTDDDDNPVRDSSGRPVQSKPVTRERTEKETHDDGPDPVLNEDNLTPEEAEDAGKGGKGNGRKTFSDKRKTRLTIQRTNPSIAVGTKQYRSGVGVPR